MKKETRTKRGSNRFIGLSVLLLFALWFGTEQIEYQLKSLKVRELKQFQSQPFDGQAESFVQGWAKGSKASGQAVADGADLDEVFLKKEETKPDPDLPAAVKPVEVSLEDQLSRQLRVEATMDNGAVINGRFYGVGKALAGISLDAGGGRFGAPVLESVTKKSIHVRCEGKRIEIPLQRPAGEHF